MRHYLRGYVERADSDGDQPIRFVAATEGRKADGLDLKMDNLDLTRFEANPVIMYGHEYFGRGSLPIGRATETKVDGGRLLATVEFDTGDEFAATVERKIRAGYLNAVSIGFDAHDVDDAGVPARWELHETSVVPIPLDPHALADARDGRTIAHARDLIDRAGKVLSAANKQAVEDAVAALAAVLEAATDADDSAADDGDADDERDNATPTLARARRRLALHEAA